MRTLLILLCAALALLPLMGPGCAARQQPARTDVVKQHFGSYPGCFLLHDRKTGNTQEFGERCDEALPPASTFKLLHSLIGLEAGAVDLATVFRYDGSPQPFRSWKRDHTLASAYKSSVVWAYQRLAGKIGDTRMDAWLEKIGYGAGERGELTSFWLDGSFTVTARDQLRLMQRLLDGELPFSEKSVAAVRNIMDEPWEGGGTFGGKTGTHKADGRLQAGWFVGHLDTDAASLAFVTLLRAEDDVWGRDAREVTRSILGDLGY